MIYPQQGNASLQRPQSNRQGMIRTGARGSRIPGHGLQKGPVGSAGVPRGRAQPARRFERSTKSQLLAQANVLAALQALGSGSSPGQSSVAPHEDQGRAHDDTQLNCEEGPMEEWQGQHMEWDDRMHIREERIGTLQLQVSYLMAKQGEDGGFATEEMAAQGV